MKMRHLDVENNICSIGPAPTTENHELEFEPSLTLPEKRASVSQVNDATADCGLTIRQHRKLLWKLDLHLIPWVSALEPTSPSSHTRFINAGQLCILYLLAFLDRANIGNAKIAGLTKDLGLSVPRFNATLTIFYVSYSVFEPLTNVLLKKLRPSVFIPILM